MLEQPPTKYARSGDLAIAYQVVGGGPIDVVYVPGWVSNLTDLWDVPAQVKFFARIGSYARLIMFDKRGTGMSDPVTSVQALEERMDDVRAVMDAAGSERAALFGLSEGGPLSLLYTASYPERVTHLVLSGSQARWRWAPDYPEGRPEAFEREFWRVVENWGSGDSIEYFLPDMVDNEAARLALGRFESRGATPAMARTITEAAMEIDVRSVLSVISVPTLIHHREGDRAIPVEGSRYMAEHIPGAELFVQPGSSHLPWIGGGRELADRIEEFLMGTAANSEVDRVLATVVFTDIVDSTATAADLGDRRWREVLDRHDEVTLRCVETYRGRLVKHTGDGALATFDRPAAAVRSALAICREMGTAGVEVRAGVHTGEVELRGDDLGGIAVHIGSRILDLAEPGRVFASRTVKDLVTGSGLEFSDRGTRVLKGIDEPWTVFEAIG